MVYLIAVLVFVGLIILLVAALTIFQLLFSGEKKASIVINNEKSVPAETGTSLLSSLATNGIFIPSACGGKGSCGLCKVQVDKGTGDILPQELPYLSREERKKNVRLSCQVKVAGPIEITLPPSLLNAQKFKAEVVHTKDLTYDIKELRFKLLEPTEIEFKAGFYIQLIVPEYYEEFRAYSICSAPSDNQHIEVMIRLMKNGLCSTYAHSLEMGDRITFTGPYGEFEYIEDEDTELILVGGGVGMAPMKSLILYTLEKLPAKKITLFFGCRAVKDMIYYEEFKELAARHENFSIYYALSEMDEGDEWEGEKGFIHLTLDKYMSKTGKRQAFLCGPPLMIHAVTRVLTTNGIKPEHIFWDDFGL